MILFLNSETNFETLENKEAIKAIEDGGVVVMPNLKFELSKEERDFLQNTKFNLDVKSIKYDVSTNRLWGIKENKHEEMLKNLISRYAICAENLIKTMFPYYAKTMKMGNTSLRPVEAEGRIQSKRHDDTLLHVDSFPSRPTHSLRLLRVFHNINLEGKPRVWNVGENFEDVANRFVPKIKPQNPIVPYILRALKITKSLRTKYDHYMLNLHDKMKLDDEYQKSVKKERIEMKAGTTWVCFSDKTSHAVLSGSGLLEQTIYIPSNGMLDPEKSPLYILERILGKKLV